MIALTIFGTPRGADAIIHPQIDLALPGTLNQAVDAPFKYYPGVEVFRLCRFRAGPKVTSFYALHSQCFDMRGPREGAFIGVGIFTTATESIDPALLVRGLRELLASAKRTVTLEGKFTRTITEARRNFQIPVEIDQILNLKQSEISTLALPLPIFNNVSRDFFVLREPPYTQIENLVDMFQGASYLPLENVYASNDPRVIADCKMDKTTTVFESIDGFLKRYDQNVRAEFAALLQKLKNSDGAVSLLKEKAATAEMLLQDTIKQRIAIEREKFRNESLRLQDEITRLKSERDPNSFPLDPYEHQAADDMRSLWQLVLAAVVGVVLLGGFAHVIATVSGSQWWVSLLAALPIVALLGGLAYSIANGDALSWWEWLVVALAISVMLIALYFVYTTAT